MERDNKVLGEIIKRLDILIALILEETSDKVSLSMSDKISKLNNLGVPVPDIARIFGKPTNYVTATLSQIKSRHQKRKNTRRIT